MLYIGVVGILVNMSGVDHDNCGHFFVTVSFRSAAVRMLPDLKPSEGEGLGNFDVLLKCQVVIAHAVGQCCFAKLKMQKKCPLFVNAGSPVGLFKWVLSDIDDHVRSDGLDALSKLAIKVRFQFRHDCHFFIV